MDAYQTLDIRPNASDEEIRAAYVAKVKEFPPDESPEKFEAIRDAYESLRDPRKRAAAMLLSTDFMAPLVSLVEKGKRNRVFAGPQLWREVLKTK